MAPPVDFPRSGPDQSLFFTLFGIGALIAILGYLTGSKTLRTSGIIIIFAATGVFIATVFTTIAVLPGLSSAVPLVRGMRRVPPRRRSEPERTDGG